MIKENVKALEGVEHISLINFFVGVVKHSLVTHEIWLLFQALFPNLRSVFKRERKHTFV